MSLADKGEDSKEHCHQGEWLEERCRHADQRGQAQASPNPSHVQTDTGCIGGLHKPEGQFDQLTGDTNLYQPCQHVSLVPLVILDPI